MTSQAPTEPEDEITDEYRDAWDATRILTVNEGFSWSGYEKNHAFLNIGQGRFADLSQLSGANVSGDGRAVATLDWDDDGWEDFVLKNRTGPRLQLFRNQYRTKASFLSVRLAGNGSTTSRDAIGARVAVELEDRTLWRTVYSADGFLAQSSKRLHFGLGAAPKIQRVSVRWPDGTTQTHEEVAADSRILITQGEPDVQVQPARTIRRVAALAPPHHPAGPKRASVARVVLAAALPLAELPVPSDRAPDRRLADLAGRAVLVNLWQRDCQPCREELVEFRGRMSDLVQSGVQLAPLCADPAPPTESDPISEEEATWDLLETGGLVVGSGSVNEELRLFLPLLDAEIFGERSTRAAPVPMSLLFDAQGRLVVVYLGRLDVDQLIADVAALGLEGDPRPLLDRLSFGRRLVHPKRRIEELIAGCEEVGLERLASYLRRIDEETRGFYFPPGRDADSAPVPLPGR